MKVLREKKPEKKLPAKRKTGKGKKLGNTSSITFLEPDGRETPMEPEDDGEKAWMDESKWLLDYYRQKNTLDDWEMIKLLDTPTQDKFGECGCCFDDEVQLVGSYFVLKIPCIVLMSSFMSTGVHDRMP